jgi:hypothetical protein
MSVTERNPDPTPDLASRRSGRRATVAVSGGATVLLGIALLPLPGPGTVVILAGLTVLRREFPSAGKAADGIKSVATRAVSMASRKPRTPADGDVPPAGTSH